MITTTRLPAQLGTRAHLDRAPQGGAARRCPPARPRAAAHRRAVAIASSSSTATTSSITSRLSTAGTKPAPIPWILCGPGELAREHGRGARLHRHHVQVRVALLQPLAAARDGPAGAHAGHQHVHPALHVAPDLLGGRAAVDLGVGGVRELVGDEGVADLRSDPAGLVTRLAHPAQRLHEPHLGAVEAHELLALAAHPLRHREHQLVAARRADEGEGDPGVAGGRLDDRGAARARSRPAPRRRRSWPRRCGPSRCRRGCRPRAWPPAPRRSPAPPGRAAPSACRRRCRPGWRARFARPVKLASPDCNRRFSPPGHGYAICKGGTGSSDFPRRISSQDRP